MPFNMIDDEHVDHVFPPLESQSQLLLDGLIEARPGKARGHAGGFIGVVDPGQREIVLRRETRGVGNQRQVEPGECRQERECLRQVRDSEVDNGPTSCLNLVPCWSPMQTWKYKIFASHLDPAELVVLLDQSGEEGWELVTVVAITDHLPVEVVAPIAFEPSLNTEKIADPLPLSAAPASDQADAEEMAKFIPMQAFRYIFKRSPMAP
jgi:hypothetical protein